jgi:pantoate--beta-alanine ligase
MLVVSDLLLSHPTSDNLHILPTTRDAKTNLALSSRNAYLSPSEQKVSPVLYRALSKAKEEWKSASSSATPITGEDIVATATSVVLAEIDRLKDAPEGDDVNLRFDYIELFDKHTFGPIRGEVPAGKEMVIAGAVWVGQTRLIDNLLLGWEVE